MIEYNRLAHNMIDAALAKPPPTVKANTNLVAAIDAGRPLPRRTAQEEEQILGSVPDELKPDACGEPIGPDPYDGVPADVRTPQVSDAERQEREDRTTRLYAKSDRESEDRFLLARNAVRHMTDAEFFALLNDRLFDGRGSVREQTSGGKVVGVTLHHETGDRCGDYVVLSIYGVKVWHQTDTTGRFAHDDRQGSEPDREIDWT